jgi:branched-chain amino acid transport system permease protein
LVLLIASLCVLIVVQNLLSLVFGDGTRTLRPGVVQSAIVIGSLHITLLQVAIVVVSTLLYVVTSTILFLTRIGCLVRAVADDHYLATVVGVPTDRVLLLVMVGASALASGAAILVAYDTDLTPMMGFEAVFIGITATVVGGMGSFPGAWLGGLLIGLARNLGGWWLPARWQDAVVFAVLVVFLLLRPQGFFGKPLKKAHL